MLLPPPWLLGVAPNMRQNMLHAGTTTRSMHSARSDIGLETRRCIKVDRCTRCAVPLETGSGVLGASRDLPDILYKPIRPKGDRRVTPVPPEGRVLTILSSSGANCTGTSSRLPAGSRRVTPRSPPVARTTRLDSLRSVGCAPLWFPALSEARGELLSPGAWPTYKQPLPLSLPGHPRVTRASTDWNAGIGVGLGLVELVNDVPPPARAGVAVVTGVAAAT